MGEYVREYAPEPELLMKMTPAELYDALHKCECQVAALNNQKLSAQGANEVHGKPIDAAWARRLQVATTAWGTSRNLVRRLLSNHHHRIQSAETAALIEAARALVNSDDDDLDLDPLEAALKALDLNYEAHRALQGNPPEEKE